MKGVLHFLGDAHCILSFSKVTEMPTAAMARSAGFCPSSWPPIHLCVSHDLWLVGSEALSLSTLSLDSRANSDSDIRPLNCIVFML